MKGDTQVMLVPKSEAEASIEIKKSKFIAIARQIESPEDAKVKITETRAEYPDATHVVHAFVSGPSGDIFGMSDDREPRGTAGRPVLEVLKGSGITNVIVMVVRYFGGTKLGTGGLVKAYTEAAQKVLSILPVSELVQKVNFRLILPYGIYDPVKKCLLEQNAEINSEIFETEIRIEGTIPEKTFGRARDEITSISNGKTVLERV